MPPLSSVDSPFGETPPNQGPPTLSFGSKSGTPQGTPNNRPSPASKKSEEARVDIDLLEERLRLEYAMRWMVAKLPGFALCTACFMVAIQGLVPTDTVSQAHEHIRKHFGIGAEDISGFLTFDEVYNFISDFEHKNEELQATSPLYWCEDRYAEYIWDDHLQVSRRYCPSPRLNSLGYYTNPEMDWATWLSTGGETRRRRTSLLGYESDEDHGEEESHEEAAESHGNETNASEANETNSTGSEHHRRLAGSSSTGDHSSSNSTCEDDDAGLQTEEGNPNVTCASEAEHVCAIDLGVIYCKQSCGYCAPFTYTRKHAFDKPQVTMLPVMVHQRRFEEMACHGFAEFYLNQGNNSILTSVPTLDGAKLDPIITCVDRTKHTEATYAHVLDCPDEAPELYCGTDHILHDTHSHKYHGETIYAKFLAEPAKNIEQMKLIGWLDLQTEVAIVSTLVYTEDLELFTSVSVEFKVDDAGTIEASTQLITYHDLEGSRKTQFIALLITVCVGGLYGLCQAVREWLKDPHCKWGFQMFELLSRSLMVCYSLVLLLTWMGQEPMYHEFELLLETLLDFHGHSAAEFDEMIQHYFDVKTVIYEETQWLFRHRVVCYFVCYVQFMQLVFYFACHPRMAIMTTTVREASGYIIHFALLFALIFFFLGFLGHWMLGGDVPEFITFIDTIQSMIMMGYGEFIYPDGAGELSGVMTIMYWIFALTYLLILSLTLQNFFLAIVVDGFNKAKQIMEENRTEHPFLSDFCDVFTSLYHYRRHRWPGMGNVLKVTSAFIQEVRAEELEAASRSLGASSLNSVDMAKRMWTVHDFQQRFPKEFENSKKAELFMHYYGGKVPKLLVLPETAQDNKAHARVDLYETLDWETLVADAQRICPEICAPASPFADKLDSNYEVFLLANKILEAAA